MARNIGALIVGMIAGMAWNMAFVMLNAYVLFPMPEGTDMQDPEQMRAYAATLPNHAFLTVLVAHVGQAAVGGFVAKCIAGGRGAVLVWIIGILTALGSAYTQYDLGGPAWMWIDGPLALLAAFLIARKAE